MPVSSNSSITDSITDLSADSREDFRDYVAHLQLHMALQARNLVPGLHHSTDSRQALLQQAQADVEKLASRQAW